jgi:signal transduction histidine kinase
LTVGFSLDARAAQRFKALTHSEIVLAADGRIRIATLPPPTWPALEPLLASDGVTPSVRIGGVDYIAATRTLAPHESGRLATTSDAAPTAVILRSRTDSLQFLSNVHKAVLLMAFAAVLVATLASYAIARTVTRPLATVTNAMREMAATGDLTKRIPVSSTGRWEDEDARLLASSFNSMTSSIARFQREAAQRERLSSLGRLSTVIAHEIRNPLMIIKTTTRAIKSGDVQGEELKAAVRDIDEEVNRLNRLVSEVLDFAKPIRFDFEPVDVNALCADAVRAVSPNGELQGVQLQPAANVPTIVSDPERLRLALVNVLTNARDAVRAAEREELDDAIRVTTAGGSDGHVTIRIRDRGNGIAGEDLPRIFDPFFTTRRTGTGLGLAITRNIIEGLGGTITIASTRQAGTEVTITLPADGRSG